jgi:hypothetical protein
MMINELTVGGDVWGSGAACTSLNSPKSSSSSSFSIILLVCSSFANEIGCSENGTVLDSKSAHWSSVSSSTTAVVVAGGV